MNAADWYPDPDDDRRPATPLWLSVVCFVGGCSVVVFLLIAIVLYAATIN